MTTHLSTGFKVLDAVTNGLNGGELILIGGRPGSKRPSLPSACSAFTAFCSFFQSMPNGGFEIRYLNLKSSNLSSESVSP